jgi:AcrR family transcriptional regulator
LDRTKNPLLAATPALADNEAHPAGRAVLLFACVRSAHIASENLTCQGSVMARDTYHHGNLRSELLDLGALELERGGVAALSLRDLAARLGVARSAPYRHFASRDELLQAIARNTVEEIRQGFLAVLQLDVTPRERLHQGFRWYLEFAWRRPELYRLLFDTDANWHIDIQEEAQRDSSFGVLLTLVAGVAATNDPAEIHADAVACWSLLHGYAMLRMNKVINRDGFVTPAEETVLALATHIDTLAT